MASFGLVLLILAREGVNAQRDEWLFMAPASFIAHGNLACAFAPHGGYAPTAPLLPLLVAGLIAATRLGMSTPFPAARALGPSCHGGYQLARAWWSHGHVEAWALALATVAWLVLVAGVVALVRTTRRGRTGVEFLACVLIAAVPPIFMTMTYPAHPEYALAFGLALLAWAQLRRDHPVWAGALLALAVVSQESALLVAIPLVVCASRYAIRVGAAAVTTTVALVVGLDVATDGRLHAVLAGGGATVPNGSTWLDTLPLQGHSVLLLSRATPLALSAALAWMVRRRVHTTADGDVARSLALIGASLDLRLIFEVNIWGYYFMGVALALVIGLVVEGRARWPTLAWLATVCVIYNPVPRAYWPSGVLGLPSWVVQLALSLWALSICVASLARVVDDRAAARSTLANPRVTSL